MKINIQLFATGGTAYPVHSNIFKVGATEESVNIIKGLENFAPSIDGNVESWYDMTEEGWQTNMVTGKAFTIDFSGKRIVGDVGNDFIANKAFVTGVAAEGFFEWTMPSGATLKGKCTINVTSVGGGDTTNVDGLEFSLLGNGKPTYTAAPESN